MADFEPITVYVAAYGKVEKQIAVKTVGDLYEFANGLRVHWHYVYTEYVYARISRDGKSPKSLEEAHRLTERGKDIMIGSSPEFVDANDQVVDERLRSYLEHFRDEVDSRGMTATNAEMIAAMRLVKIITKVTDEWSNGDIYRRIIVERNQSEL